MDTKLKSDIAESAVLTRLLKEGFRVLKPVGDRLPYDLALDMGKKLFKIQVKSAWGKDGIYNVDSRRTKTNRRKMLRSRYAEDDFDFAVLYIEDLGIFYVMPRNVFDSYKSGIRIVEKITRQRTPRSGKYREAWDLLKRAA
ncbi:MAG TPA: group I intron-associated PD-(D/E)XK endonuclease [Candidatus Omnitrophota bacterium]|nr:group I intron-associated PD-(D/E)XK endonuclease [Candidatus Omnitrophota bacterium]HRY85129.1 group I intron-associated PD-(D/E)XK endonuclease [Candidatus Omnitrophota bacterium]